MRLPARLCCPTSDLFNSGKELGGLQPLSFQGAGYTGIARELPVARKMGWPVLGSHPAGARGVRSGSKEVCTAPSRNALHTRRWQRDPTETEVRARMKVLIGVDPHKAAVAVAVV